MNAPENLVPAPWRTLARTLLQLLVALVILSVIWWGWSTYATHRLQSQLAIYHARGEPSSVQDFVHTTPPADQNAYELSMAAFNSLTLSTAEEEVIAPSTGSSLLKLPLSDADMATIRGMLEHSKKTLDLISKARTAPANVWPLDPKDPLGPMSYPKLGPFRKLANYCRIAALYYHQNHQDRLAIDEIMNLLALSKLFSNDEFLINHLVAIGISSVASDVVVEIAPNMKLKSEEVPEGAIRNDVTELMQKFLDIDWQHKHLIDALKNERVYIFHLEDASSFHSPLLEPAFKLDVIRGMEGATRYISAISPNIPLYAEFRSRIPDEAEEDSNLYSITHLISGGSSSYSAVIKMHYRGLIDMESAGLELAICMYRLDHDGALPASLENLVPHYFSKLPVDLFNPKGGSFKYDPGGRLFYSLNVNGTDEGGKWTPGRPGLNWRGDDAVYPLDWPPPASPPISPATTPTYVSPAP